MAINGVFAAYNFCNERAYTKKEKLKYSIIILIILAGAFISLSISKNEYTSLRISPLGLQLSTMAFAVISIILLPIINTPDVTVALGKKTTRLGKKTLRSGKKTLQSGKRTTKDGKENAFS